MLTTEEEAKTRQCRVIHAAFVPMPMQQKPSQIALSYEGPIQFTVGYGNCIGSKCMMWRWACGLDTEGPQGFCGAGTRPTEFVVR